MTINKTTQVTESNLNQISTAPVRVAPYNAVTGKEYFGAKAARPNAEADYRSHMSQAWATMKQWNGIKETIAKGEKGTLVIHMEKKPDGTEEQKRSFLFNRCQLVSFADCNDKPF